LSRCHHAAPTPIARFLAFQGSVYAPSGPHSGPYDPSVAACFCFAPPTDKCTINAKLRSAARKHGTRS